jgi:tRNA(Ile2) C34 agmatinyltransferase TiaS
MTRATPLLFGALGILLLLFAWRLRFKEPRPVPLCPQCGQKMREIGKTGFFDCPKCWYSEEMSRAQYEEDN